MFPKLANQKDNMKLEEYKNVINARPIWAFNNN